MSRHSFCPIATIRKTQRNLLEQPQLLWCCGWMLPPLREHYRNRIAEIEAELNRLGENPPRSVVLFGDSITECHPARRLRGYPVVNMGISGDEADSETGGLLRRVDLVGRANPAELFMLVGINDLCSGKTPVELIKQIGEVLEALQKAVPAATIFAQTILPTTGEYLHLRQGICEANDLLRREVEKRELPLLDLFTPMSDENGSLRQDLTNDGVHLVSAGYELWTGLMEAAPWLDGVQRGS